MSATLTPSPHHPDRPPRRAARAPDGAADLGTYRDRAGRDRVVIARPGVGGSVLVIDQDARTLTDRRLVAHLAADEPAVNARVVAELYLADDPGRRFAGARGPRLGYRCPAVASRPTSPSRRRPANCATHAGAATAWPPSTTTATAARRAGCAAPGARAPSR